MKSLARLLLPFALFGLTTTAFPGERHALVIGNGAYTAARKLPNPANDAGDLALGLRVGGWKVTTVEDAGVKVMVRALREFCETARGAEAALFFYAGHGVEVGSQNYLLPVDATLAEEDGEDALPLETLALDKVLTDLGKADIGLKFVVLDCCRDNPLQRSWLRSRSGGGGLADVKEDKLAEGTMLVFSTPPGKTAEDGRGRNSPFTAAFLQRLPTGGGAVDIFGDVAKTLGTRQMAWIRFDGSGASLAAFRNYLLVPSSASASSIPTIAPRHSEEKPPAMASKSQPFENSLGMKFVPVVNYKDGRKVLFSIWETRRQDYAVYAAKNSGVDESWRNEQYKGVPVGHEDAHPVVNVSWEEAKSYCAWLTQVERAAGRIGLKDEYRLPTDMEWSYAVGIGEREDGSASPKDKDGKIADEYPWGPSFPPPSGSGNYADRESKVTNITDDCIGNYDDGYATSAPVGLFEPNVIGLYDLGGNVWEWCQDEYDGERGDRVLRGGSWWDSTPLHLLSSYRGYNSPGFRCPYYGFRCVLVVSGG